MESTEKIVEQTKSWLSDIVIDLNFCPFAKKEFVNNTIEYVVIEESDLAKIIPLIQASCEQLKQNNAIETSLLIFNQGFEVFDEYLDLVDVANDVLDVFDYIGDIQVASFHPDYCFEGVDTDDVQNYTNRSPWPMLHLIREDSLEKVLSIYPNPDEIPENNIRIAEQKGIAFFTDTLNRIAKR